MSINHSVAVKRLAFLGSLLLILALMVPAAVGFQVRQEQSRFDHLVIHDPSNVSVATTPLASLDSDHPLRAGWNSFLGAHGASWNVYLDSRSGAPLLVEGQGIPLIPGFGNTIKDSSDVTVNRLETIIRAFMEGNVSLLLANGNELVLNHDASLQVTPELWQIVFNRKVSGIPVAGDQYIFSIGHGNLISFGATRWGRITTSPIPSLPSDVALKNLFEYMELTGDEQIEYLNAEELIFLPLASSGRAHERYDGTLGEGYNTALAWRFVMRVDGEPGTWVGMIDAHSGAVLAFYDDNKYAQVKGGVYPESDDQICPSGCEQPNFPMPFANLNVGGTPQTANTAGYFDCSPGGATATTTLNAPYVYVHDNCGSISESVLCDEDLDMRTSGGADCTVPAGSSPGNTHASRSTFYHINRAKEIARGYLPSTSWLSAKLTDNVNISSTCNAYWNGTVNFYRSGGGCNNTGEIAGVVLHEWGHGFDQNDGGGYDNPSEAYADTSEFLYDHTSCIGRGFFQTHDCTGYGNACLDCTGIRDQDWDKREDHVPSTAAGFIMNNCGGGSGPCGKEEHCEGYLGGETIWDLGARDLPAAGYDQATAWQILDRIWYKSRAGSSGKAYNCTPPNSDGCGSYTWFTKLRTIDDDDGNLNNGTPHAAAIFNAFKRHNIACGSANDTSNKNSSVCPSISGTMLSGTAGSNSASLSWTAVTNASTYNILRNDIGCDHSYAIVATVSAPNTSYTDPDLANDFTVHYRVQAIGANSSCLGTVSNCVDVTPQPFAGSIKFSRPKFNCDDTITITVRDANVGASTLTVKIWSETEPDFETVVLTETEAGSARFVGTIDSTPGPAASDGILSLTNADTISAEYIDADDGMGGHNLVRQTAAVADCVGPIISNIQESGITDTRVTISWNTDESSDTLLTWGPTKPPTNERYLSSMGTYHSVTLTGLQSCTVYYYQVSSTDSSMNRAADDNAGQYYHFETYGNFGQGLQPCHEGRLTVLEDIYHCSSDTISFQIIDMDLNPDPDVVDAATLQVTSTTESSPEYVTVTETSPYSSTFTGSITTSKGAPVQDGMLQANDGDVLTVTYLDADDGSGSPKVAFDTAVFDCGGPGIRNLMVSGITDHRFTVSFNTVEAGDTVVNWGPTPSLGNTITLPALTTSHQVALNKLSSCDPFYIRVSSADVYGNRDTSDLNGEPHRINTWLIPGLYWQETFEGDTSGWSLDGEWEIGAPQGLGGSYGLPDPDDAYNNDKIIGSDLTGLGTYPGDYEHYIEDENAESPALNASSWTNTKLIMYRQLNIRFQDIGSLSVVQGKTENELYNSNHDTIEENGFSQQTYDVSSIVDGKSSFKLKFHIFSEVPSYPYDDGVGSGWNVDDIIFKDGTLPDYTQCGGCGMVPSFNGVKNAFDNDSCGATGVTISWDAAVAWGTGSSGTYTLYRDVIPDFTPSAANRIVAGLAGTSYNDTTAPTDQTLYYLVRAENNETCGSGPNNDGVMDGNQVFMQVAETTTWQIPDEVMTLRAEMINAAHIRLSWNSTGGAVSYRIYRSTSPNGTFTLLAETSEMYFDDLHQGGNAASFYYKVAGVSPCNQEGP